MEKLNRCAKCSVGIACVCVGDQHLCNVCNLPYKKQVVDDAIAKAQANAKQGGKG